MKQIVDQELLLKEYPVIRRVIQMDDGWVGAYPTLVQKNYDNKAALRKALSLPDDGRLALDIESVKPTEKFKRTLRLLRAVTDIDNVTLQEALESDKMLAANKLASGAKLSKAILKGVNPVLFQRYGNMTEFNMLRISGELPKLPPSLPEGNMTDKELSLVIQNLFSEIAGNTKKAYISTNPWDILNASHAGGTHSCFNIAGEYRTAPYSFVCDERTLIGYVSGSGTMRHASGRFWVFFNEDFTEVICHKAYGSLGDEVLEAILKEIANRLSKDNSKWHILHDYSVAFGIGTGSGTASLAANDVGNVYIDPYAQALLYDKANGGTHAGFLIQTSKPICPACGEHHADRKNKSIFCADCQKKIKLADVKHCAECGRIVLDDKPAKTIDGRVFCSMCVKTIASYGHGWKKCDNCGRYRRSDKCNCIPPKELLCLSCFEVKPINKTVDGYHICADCEKAATETTCHDCGCDDKSLVLCGGHMRCPSCAIEKFTEQSGYATRMPCYDFDKYAGELAVEGVPLDSKEKPELKRKKGNAMIPEATAEAVLAPEPVPAQPG